VLRNSLVPVITFIGAELAGLVGTSSLIELVFAWGGAGQYGLTAILEGQCRIGRELGAGGMGTVVLAHDLNHDRDVAITVSDPDRGAALVGERFVRNNSVTRTNR
jgi:ABC-type antimicrobial peptide transport system permease subunit